MNILEFLKNGSGIHIKKKNRGSFTRWCGGNVTEECIRKGKASSNPKIRKKATFADNTRHFKHKKGGKAFVNGVSVLDSNLDAYKQVKKKVKMRQWGGDITINESPLVTQVLNWKRNAFNTYLQQQQQRMYKQQLELQQQQQESDFWTNLLNAGIDYISNKNKVKE